MPVYGSIGTIGQVVGVVPLAREFERSIVVNPKRERHITSFCDHEESIDEAFTHFIQKKSERSD